MFQAWARVSRKTPRSLHTYVRGGADAGMANKACAVLILGVTFVHILLFDFMVFCVSLFACHTVNVQPIVLPGSASTIENLGPTSQAFASRHVTPFSLSPQARNAHGGINLLGSIYLMHHGPRVSDETAARNACLLISLTTDTYCFDNY